MNTESDETGESAGRLRYQSGTRDDPCDRCGAEIHVLEPATGVELGGGIESDGLLFCADCADEFVEWFERGDGDAE